MSARRVPHGDLTLAVHELQSGSSPALLLVHELEGSARSWRAVADARTAWASWPGSVFALDLAGHGASDWRQGHAYTPELFAADIDATLAEIGVAVVAGAGLGAYASLLVAGARPELVAATLLLSGRGLSGGGGTPAVARGPAFLASVEQLETERFAHDVQVDPLVRSCASDLRPPDYACAFAAGARRIVLHEDGLERPPWWESIRGQEGVVTTRDDLAVVLAALVTAC